MYDRIKRLLNSTNAYLENLITRNNTVLRKKKLNLWNHGRRDSITHIWKKPEMRRKYFSNAELIISRRRPKLRLEKCY